MDTTTPSRRSHLALGAVVVALIAALLGGAFTVFPGASAGDTRELIKVSFRPATVRPLTSWRSDNGQAFDARRAYGWVRDTGRHDPVSMAPFAATSTRTSIAARTETAITMQPRQQRWGRWVMAVANGNYRVAVTVGDPAGSSNPQTLAVEGKRVIDRFVPSRSATTRTETVDVKVTDGRLTLDPLYPTSNTRTKLVSVVVSEVLDGDRTPVTEPATTEPPATLPPTTQPATTQPPTTQAPTTLPPTTLPPTTQPSGLRTQTGFAGGGVFLQGSDAEILRELDGMKAAGSTWLRVGFLWSGIEASKGEYRYSKLDKLVGWANERGIRIVANVSFTPTWARQASCASSMQCPPVDNADYARFMGNLVRHFSPMGVKTYEVWNEPNQYFWWNPKPNPAAYTDMLKKAYVQAHQADPNVTVLAGVFAPAADNESGSTINPRTFLTAMYRAGAAGHFDALSFHPYSGTNDPAEAAYWNMMTNVGPDLVTIAALHGDLGIKIWGTEMSYATGTSNKAVSETEQANLMIKAIRVWQSQPYAGPLFLFTYRDMGTNASDVNENYGLVRRDFTPKQALRAVTEELTR